METDGLLRSRARRNRVILIAVIVMAAASAIGVASYVSHVNETADRANDAAAELAVVAKQVCTRQDEVIAVLDYLVSPEPQALIQSRGDGDADDVPNPALIASNLKIRGLVATIEASPCNPSQEGP